VTTTAVLSFFTEYPRNPKLGARQKCGDFTLGREGEAFDVIIPTTNEISL
jgi:hypothetical protein